MVKSRNHEATTMDTRETDYPKLVVKPIRLVSEPSGCNESERLDSFESVLTTGSRAVAHSAKARYADKTGRMHSHIPAEL